MSWPYFGNILGVIYRSDVSDNYYKKEVKLSHHLTQNLKMQDGSVFLKKTKKYLWFRKLIVCYKPSPLDWIMMIWTIFGLPGALWGPKRSMQGLGGLMKTNFTDFHRGQFLALRCCFLDLTSFYHYVFGFLGQNLGLGAKKRPFRAKIGYMQKWIFLKNVGFNLAQIAPK